MNKMAKIGPNPPNQDLAQIINETMIFLEKINKDLGTLIPDLNKREKRKVLEIQKAISSLKNKCE